MRILPSLAVSLTAAQILALSAPAQRPTAPKPPTYLTENQARETGPDFDLQGEYSGPGIGAQIIALGNDTFRAVFLKGGLPGAGWDKTPKVEIEAKRVDDSVTFENDDWKAVLKKDSLVGKWSWGAFEMKKTVRQSPTLGAKPPGAAVVLFDGSSCDAFVEGHFDDLNRNLLASGSKTKRADFEK